MKSFGKNVLIAGAVAAGIASGSAFAVAPTVAPGAVFYAGGGSAQANAFYVAACRLMNNMDVYSDNGAALSTDYYVMYGTLKAKLGSLNAGTNVAYVYKFNGGSFTNGIAPDLASNPTQLPMPNVTASSGNTVLNQATAVTGQTAGTACTNGGVPTYSYVSGNVPTTNQSTDFGLADVEVPMFKNFNNPTGNLGGSAQNTNGGPAPAVGTPAGLYDNLFGFAVTANVYAVKKNFTKAEIAGILSGTISDFSQLYDDTGHPMTAGGIIFLDRGEGSGTKASGNEYFLGYPGDDPGAVLPNSASNAYCGTTFAACGGAQAHYDVAEGSTNAVITDLQNAQAGGKRAVAVLGMENPPGKNLVSGAVVYDFVAINGTRVDTGATGDDINGSGAGAGTSYINAIKGNYDFYFQNSFNIRNNLGAQAAANAAAFQTAMSATDFVGANSGVAFPGALPGTLVDASTAATLVPGVTINTRNQVSTGPLVPSFDATFANPLPTTFDPI